MASDTVNAFIDRWRQAGGSERANYQLFLMELCELLDLPKADPAGEDTRDNAYVFERRVVLRKPDGSENNGFIDLYKRGCFVLEAKQTGKTLDSSGWDKAMLRAHNQADQYARALPADEGRPPFILVVDVGRNIELYAEFSRSGATYVPYPDARNHRLRLEDLRQDDIRERLRAVWLDPLSLDPSRRAARVTRDIADQLAKLAKSLESAQHSPQQVAGFLMRCLFTMFAEDVGLLPERGFTQLLERLKNKPDTFAPMLENLWQTMNHGGFSPILEHTLLRFNGGLFAESHAIALDRDQIELLMNAARADWRYVEPAIFGTLLERALNPRERHKLGAHYTPRAYVERLVLPTIIEPLRTEWQDAQAAALTYEQQGKHKEAVGEVKRFQRHLCTIRVLDPACGSGNFLYVTLEHMKRLEGEVLNLLHDLGESQGLLELEGITVDPHQFLGLEINPRAAKIAEMVLWIGYLQWHFRTHGKINPPEPVLRDFKNIECRDALITYERTDVVCDEQGKPLSRWDGITYKISPITGEDIPDEAAQVEQIRYVNPQKAEWPQADFIVGNPPFIGNKRMRSVLGPSYAEAIRTTWTEVPDTADFVMFWWHISAEKVRASDAKRFGFITTNSIKQTFNQRVIQPHLEGKGGFSIAYAIPDHPWIDASDGAAVRIAMTVGAADTLNGCLCQLVRELPAEAGVDAVETIFSCQSGNISADLRVGANLTSVKMLKSLSSVCFQGVKLVQDRKQKVGRGFRLTAEQRDSFLEKGEPESVIREYWTGSDLTDFRKPEWVIDFYGFSLEQAREKSPLLYQRLLTDVKPYRDHVERKGHRENWWVFGEPRPGMRAALLGISNFIATSEVAKHRIFVRLNAQTALADGSLMVMALGEHYFQGVLSSRIHVAWALAIGGRMGAGNDPRYNKNRCFETFPFPETSGEQKTRISDLADKLDTHRKRQQSQHPDLTLTGMYNVLEKLRSGETLNAKEKIIHEQGLVSILRELHDELDRAVFAAYGWDDLAEKLVGLPGATTPLPDKSEAQAEAEEELLCRLVALNHERAAEEARGLIRWLRPEYQNPEARTAAPFPEQAEAELESDQAAPVVAPAGKLTWPKEMREQIQVVRNALAAGGNTATALAAQFKRSPVEKVKAVLDSLEALGMVEHNDSIYVLV